MKKKKVALITTSFIAAMNMNGCGVYGPPANEETLNHQIQKEAIQNDETKVLSIEQTEDEIHGEAQNGQNA